MITRLRLTLSELHAFGLQPANDSEYTEFRDLGQLVVLAGPNGGGKTRHLRLVQQVIKNVQTRLRTNALFEPSKQNKPPNIDTSTDLSSLGVVSLGFKHPALPPATDRLTPSSTKATLISARKQGFNEAFGAMTAAVSAIAHRHHSGPVPDEKFPTQQNLDHIERNIEALLGTKVGYNLTGLGIVPTLFDRALDLTTLSPGQHTLLTWAVLLELQREAYCGQVVLIDEPDTNLHPDICWRALKTLLELAGDSSQLWIATHSLPLIAQAGPGSLYFVEAGTARYASTTPSRIWSSILGDEGAQEQILDLMKGDAIAALVQYCSESLTPPTSVPFRDKDPQAEDYIDVVAGRLKDMKPTERIHILEYGAGRGRLATALALRLSEDQGTRLRYTAVNDAQFATPDEHEHCRRAVTALQARGVAAQYAETLEHRGDTDHAPQIVVLANVLHEIPASQWLQLFKNLAEIAAPGAELLVVEDQEPRIGELPHSRGLLLLEDSEWHTLAGDKVTTKRRKQGVRDLTMFTIPLGALARADSEHLSRALHQVKERAISEIRRVREDHNTGYAAGRRHAFYALMHVNAVMALEALTGPPMQATITIA